MLAEIKLHIHGFSSGNGKDSNPNRHLQTSKAPLEGQETGTFTSAASSPKKLSEENMNQVMATGVDLSKILGGGTRSGQSAITDDIIGVSGAT